MTWHGIAKRERLPCVVVVVVVHACPRRTARSIQAAAAVDVNMDGLLDVVVLDGKDSTVVWYENLGGTAERVRGRCK